MGRRYRVLNPKMSVLSRKRSAMLEIWSEIRSFPGYSVSNEGVVRNDGTGRLLAQMRNQSGLPYVGMSRDGLQYKRSISTLVARAFLPDPTLKSFNVTINLDGDRLNNRSTNLQWRPLWFARKYHQQFHDNSFMMDHPIINIKTGERFENSWEAAKRYGLLNREILSAILNRTYVWPTFQMFQLLEE